MNLKLFFSHAWADKVGDKVLTYINNGNSTDSNFTYAPQYEGDKINFELRNNLYALVAENPDFPPIKLKEGQEITIWGVVTNVIHKV